MFAPISGDGNASRFALRLQPDGVYRVDGRVIPVADHSAKPVGCIDDSESVIGIHGCMNVCVGVLGRVGAVHIEQ